MQRDLAIRALDMAVALRQPPEGCIHHTDRGSQYCSGDHQKQLSKHGFKVSMSGKGKCYDNSMVETFLKCIKAELIWRNRWETRRQAKGAIFKYISRFSNPRRHHSSLGGKSPLAFEQKATSMELIDRDPSPTRTVTAKCQCHSPQLRKVFQLHSFWPICQSAIRNSPAF